MTPRTVRCSDDLDKRIAKATREAGFGSESAFIRAAIENELRRRGPGDSQPDGGAAASFERVALEVRRLATGQQALFALVDTLAKTLLTCVPEPSGDAYQQAIARGKARYDRFLKSVGSGLSGESGKAFTELADHVNR
jgi:hypothetical protein